MYEKLLHKRLSDYVENILFLCGFRKAHSTQHALFKLLQSWHKELDEKGMVGTVLMDLSKAYGCIPRDLSIAKLNAYGIVVLIVWGFYQFLIISLTVNKNRK